MSRESFSDAGSDTPGTPSSNTVARSEAEQRFEAYLAECIERLLAEIGTRLSGSLQQTLGRLVNVQARLVEALEKLEAEQRYLRAQIERLSSEVTLLRQGKLTSPMPRSRRAWTHRHRRLLVAPRLRVPKD
jgi:cell division protein FtsB